MLSCWSFDDTAWSRYSGPRRGMPVKGSGVTLGVEGEGDQTEEIRIPLEKNTAERAKTATAQKREAILEWASLTDNGELQSAPQCRDAHSAFLLINIPAGVGPKSGIRFQQVSNIREDIVNGRVVRSFNKFPPLGVHVLAEHTDQDGVVTKLLRMLPGASFKVVRHGYLEGAPSTFHLTWTGIAWRTEAKGGGGRKRRVVI